MGDIYTINEAIATLRRTQLPSVIIEGKDDLCVFRRLEARFDGLGLSFFPMNGRNNVIQVFKRRDEYADRVPVAFALDRDLWIYTGVPEEFLKCNVILTDGYSIENDVFRDGELDKLLLPHNRQEFQCDIEKIVRWYAWALQLHLVDQNISICRHPNYILSSYQCDESFWTNTEADYPYQLFQRILNDYARLLRGKTLLQALSRRICLAPDQENHRTRSLIEYGAARQGFYVEGMFQSICRAVGVA